MLSRAPLGRKHLADVLKDAGDVIKVSNAQSALSLSRSEAAKRLARWTDQGWLRRVGPGAYVPVPLDALESDIVVADPWVLVPYLFGPAYVGGRTAAEHWDLTEQIFRDVVVLTAKAIRRRSQVIQGVTFTLKRVQERALFGTKTVWRGRTRVPVSDVHRTLVDMLSEPALGAGIQHVNDCLISYLQRDDVDVDLLVDYAERADNGAVFKRLGFLSERTGVQSGLMEACRVRLTQGNAKLDPALKAEKLVTRWRLWVPQSWAVTYPSVGVQPFHGCSDQRQVVPTAGSFNCR